MTVESDLTLLDSCQIGRQFHLFSYVCTFKYRTTCGRLTTKITSGVLELRELKNTKSLQETKRVRTGETLTEKKKKKKRRECGIYNH